jgi:CubicO group peptidase (beta-lactamase class C family)
LYLLHLYYFFKQQQVIAYSQQQPSFATTTNSLGKRIIKYATGPDKTNSFQIFIKRYKYFQIEYSISMVLGVVTPNGTQVSGYGNLSKANSTEVDGNTIFDIASITKTFATIVLADMVKQGLVNLNDPIEKYLPSNATTVPSYNGHKITLNLDLANLKNR